MSEPTGDPDPSLVAARVGRPSGTRSPLTGLAGVGTELLALDDPELHELICAAQGDLEATISLSATAGIIDPTVTGAMTSFVAARPPSATELPPVERLTADRALRAFLARRAYPVQPDVGSVVEATCCRDAKLLAPVGTHPSANVHYPPGDSEKLRSAVHEHRPDVVLCYVADVGIARELADRCGALVICDISEIATLVVAGLLDNPVDIADVTILSTSDQLGGPNGSLMLLGERGERRGLPGGMGLRSPSVPALAGMARALEVAREQRGRDMAARMLANSRHLADELHGLGYAIGPDHPHTPVIEIDLDMRGLPGPVARTTLREVNIAVDEPGDRLRIGVQAITQRGFGPSELRQLARLIHDTLSATTAQPGSGWHLDEFTRLTVGEAVLRLVRQFPLPRHVPASYWSESP